MASRFRVACPQKPSGENEGLSHDIVNPDYPRDIAAAADSVTSGKRSEDPDFSAPAQLVAVRQSREGWVADDRSFGLEMQRPWSGLMLSGEKSVETRGYELPAPLLGVRVEILEPRAPGSPGVSGLGDVLDGDQIGKSVRLVGWCVFSRVIVYRDGEAFDADKDLHLVTRGSRYGWKDGETEVLYGWVVGHAVMYEEGHGSSDLKLRSITRRMRSLFEIVSG